MNKKDSSCFTLWIKSLSSTLILATITMNAFTQGVGINETGAAPDPSAVLDVFSTTKGMLIPRVTLSERNAIVLPAAGLMVYQTDDTAGFYFNAGTPVSVNWQLVGFNAVAPSQWISSGDNIYYNDGYIGIGTNSPTASLNVNNGNIRIINGNLDFGDQHRIITYTANNNMSVQSPGPVSVVLDNNNNQNSEAFTVRKDNVDPDLATELFRVQENGRIGIGTSSPEYRFHVKNGDAMVEDSSWCNFKIKSLNFNTDPALLLYAGDSVWAIVNDDSENNDLDFRYNNYTWMSVEKDGRVSIGSNQSDPSSILQLYSTSKGFLPPTLTSTQIMYLDDPADGLMVYNITDDHIYVYTNSTNEWKRLNFDSQTITPFSCGSSITVTHNAGVVAPVTKTVTYGTVSYETGNDGQQQCWTTQNLGSDHQASSATDATEASAGWYWQFNRKQGYKHTGSLRTPNTTWIWPIEEDVNWQPSNDPCYLLLGIGWRVPAGIEWADLDYHLGWNNYNDSYASDMKLHAAGYLDMEDGTLEARGILGYYWSSWQGTISFSDCLNLGNSFCYISGASKSQANSLRCVRD